MEHQDNKYSEVSGNTNIKISTKITGAGYWVNSPVMGKSFKICNFPSTGGKGLVRICLVDIENVMSVPSDLSISVKCHERAKCS